MQQLDEWDKQVINTILADKEQCVKQVTYYEYLLTLIFYKEKYPEIINLINNQDWEALK